VQPKLYLLTRRNFARLPELAQDVYALIQQFRPGDSASLTPHKIVQFAC
jgi:hypothetical protein